MNNNKNVLLRVTQMNAIYLNDEIFKSILQLYKDAAKHLPPGLIVPLEPEINVLIKFAILRYSILNADSTFGQQLLCIKYKSVPVTSRILYVLANCISYITKRIELWKPSHNIHHLFSHLNLIVGILDFINLSVFLRCGVKPLLIERILGLEQVYATENPQRMYESKYLARELLWNGFIELLVYVLPLINYHKIKRTLKHYYPLGNSSTERKRITARQNITMHTKCAHCGENPILPHHMGCLHIFCYVCLKGNQEADGKYECPICEHKNSNMICTKVTEM